MAVGKPAAIHHYLESIPQRILRHRSDILTILIFLLAVFICMIPVIFSAGWPLNHDYFGMATRTHYYAAHLSQGDLFPIWSSSDASGFGTPMLFFYHKIFFMISGFLLLIIGSVKTALIITIMLLLLVGTYGVYKCIGLFSDNYYIRVGLSLLLPFSSYAFTDWLVRGALAEFSAFMVVPYVLYWTLMFVRTGTVSYSIIPSFIILYFCHNLLAMTMLFVIFCGIVVFFSSRASREKKITAIKRGGLAFIMMAVLFLPYIATFIVYSSDYRPASAITEEGFSPANHLVPLEKYFFQDGYSWLKTFGEFSVQIDYSIWVSIAIIGLALILRWVRHGRQPLYRPRPEAIVIGISLAVLFFMQLWPSKAIYSSLPVLDVLQFPWRMLAIIIPLAICVLAMLLEKWSRDQRKTFVVPMIAIIVGVSVVMSPIFSRPQYPSFSSNFYDMSLKYRIMQNGAIGIGEYLPIMYDSQEHRAVKTIDKYAKYVNDTYTYPIDSPCLVTRHYVVEEPRTVELSINCNSVVQDFPLPQNYSRLTRVTDKSGRDIATHRSADDPRIRVDLPSGDQVIHIYQPRLGDVGLYLLRYIEKKVR